MAENDKAILIYTTFPSPAMAEEVGAALVEQNLAACVNILPGMTSIHVWEGRRCRDSETVMIIKTAARLAERVTAEVKRRHSYDNPAIVCLPLVGGSAEFLGWIEDRTRAASADSGSASGRPA